MTFLLWLSNPLNGNSWPPTRVPIGYALNHLAGVFLKISKNWLEDRNPGRSFSHRFLRLLRREVPTKDVVSLRELASTYYGFLAFLNQKLFVESFFWWEFLVGLENETTNKEANELAKTGMGDIMLQRCRGSWLVRFFYVFYCGKQNRATVLQLLASCNLLFWIALK